MFEVVDDFTQDSAEHLTQQVDAEYQLYDHNTLYTPTPSDSPTETITPTPSKTQTYTPTPSETESFTPTPSETESFTPTPSETVTITAPTPTMTETKTLTVTPTITHPTPTPTMTETVTITHPSPTPSITITPTFAITPTPLATPTPTMTQTVTAPTETPSISMTPTVTITSSVSLTPTMTQTQTISFTPTMTQTETMSFTPTMTISPTVTKTETTTQTVTDTETMSITPTLTITQTNTNTETISATPTVSITPTVTKTYTVTPTMTHTETMTVTPTVTKTDTVTQTMTHTETMTVTPTVTKTETITNTVTMSMTPTITETQTVTITHPTPTPSPTITKTLTLTPTPSPTITKTSTPTPSPPRIVNLSDNQTHTGYLQFVVEEELEFSGIAMSYEIVNDTDAVSNAKESVALIPNTLQDGEPKSRYAIISTSGDLIPFSSLFDEYEGEGRKTFRFTFATVQNETIQLKEEFGKVDIKVVLYNNGQTTEYTYDSVYKDGYNINAPDSTPTPSQTSTPEHTPTPTSTETVTITHPTPTPTITHPTPTPTPEQTPTPTISPPLNSSIRIVHKKHEHIYYDEIQIYPLENVTLRNFQVCLVSKSDENFYPIHETALQNTYEGYLESRTFLRRLEAYKRISFNNTLGTTSLPFEYVGNLKIEDGVILPDSPQKVDLTQRWANFNNKRVSSFRFEMINNADPQYLVKDTWNTVFRIIHPHDIRLDNETNEYYEIEINEAEAHFMMGTSVTPVEISSIFPSMINDQYDYNLDVYNQHNDHANTTTTTTQLLEHLQTRYVMIESIADDTSPFFIGPEVKSNLLPEIEFYAQSENNNGILYLNHTYHNNDGFFTIYDFNVPNPINSIQMYKQKDDVENKRFASSKVNMYYTNELSQSVENSSQDDFSLLRSFDIPDNKFADNRYINPYFHPFYTEEYRYIGVAAFDGCDDGYYSSNGIIGANFEIKMKELFIQFTDGTWIGHGSKPYASVTLNYDLKDGYQLEDAWGEVATSVQFKQIRTENDWYSKSYLLFYFDMGENNKKSIAYAYLNHQDMLASESPITPQIYATNDIHGNALSTNEIFSVGVQTVTYIENDSAQGYVGLGRNRYDDGAMEWKYMCPIQIYGLYMGSERFLSSYKPRYLMLYAYPQLGDSYFGITQIALRTTKGDIISPDHEDLWMLYDNDFSNSSFEVEILDGTIESHPISSKHERLVDNKHRLGEYGDNPSLDSRNLAEEAFGWRDDQLTDVNYPSVIMQIDLGENYDERPDVKDLLIYTKDMACMIAPGTIGSDHSVLSSDFNFSEHVVSSSVIVEMIFVQVSNHITGPYTYSYNNNMFPTIIDYGTFYMPTTYFLNKEKPHRKKISPEKALELSNRAQNKNKVIQLDRMKISKNKQQFIDRKNQIIQRFHIDGNVEGNIDGNVEA